MKDDDPTLPAPADHWEIFRLLHEAWDDLKWAAACIAGFVALLVVSQVVVLHLVLAQLHPVLGWLSTAAFVAAFAGLVVRPIGTLARLPPGACPPDVDLGDPDLTRTQLRSRLDADDGWLDGMLQNPAFSSQASTITAIREDLATLRASLRSGGAVRALADQLDAIEENRIAPLLAPIDAEVDAYIQKEALEVGVLTAASASGFVDALIVLWRNANMVVWIVQRYYGRGSIRLCTQVLVSLGLTVVSSRVLEAVADTAGDVLKDLLGNIAGRLFGALLDGSANALMTLKLGYLTRRRCNTFREWTDAHAESHLGEVISRVEDEAEELVRELIERHGGATIADEIVDVVETVDEVVDKTAAVIIEAPRSAWSRIRGLFRRR